MSIENINQVAAGAEVNADAGFSKGWTIGVTAGVLIAAGVAYGGYKAIESHDGPKSQDTANSTDLAPGCNALEFDNAAADAAKYISTAFLPKTDPTSIETTKGATNYVIGKNGLFASPLGGNADKASLAAINAIITDRATDKTAAVDPKYSYGDHFSRDLASYSGENGDTAAKNDCNDTYKVLSQVAQYNSSWARKGEKVTEFVAVRGANNDITGFQAKDEIASSTMTGIEYAERASDKGLSSGFPSVLETSDGNLFVKGFAPNESNKGENGKPTPTPTPTSGANQGKNTGNNGGGSNSGENGSTGGTNGTSNGSGVSKGQKPEKNSGPAGGNKSGNGGTSEGTGGGKDNTPGGGGGKSGGGSGGGNGGGSGGGNGGGSGGGNGGGGNTPPSGGGNTPPPTQPPETQPPSTTPPSQPPATKPPIDCDPNIDVCPPSN